MTRKTTMRLGAPVPLEAESLESLVAGRQAPSTGHAFEANSAHAATHAEWSRVKNKSEFEI